VPARLAPLGADRPPKLPTLPWSRRSLRDQEDPFVTKKMRIVKVSRDQVTAARALIELRGGADKIHPLIAKIAQAGSTRTAGSAAERAS
jgi:hypothetical protein